MIVYNHLYDRPETAELACGLAPGPDSPSPEAEWHTGRDKVTLLRLVEEGQRCCPLCLRIARG